MNWQKRDTAVANIFNNFNNGDFAAFSADSSPLPTGGVVNITAEANYSKLGLCRRALRSSTSYTPAITVASSSRC